MLRELSNDESLLVSGGNANSNYEGGRFVGSSSNSSSWSHMGQNAPNKIYSGPGTADCAKGVFFKGIASNFPNPVKMGFGVAKSADLCLNNNHGGGNFGGDSNSNSVNGQCHW